MENDNYWFTGYEGHVATDYDFHRDYPFFEYRKPNARRQAEQLINPAAIPNPERWEMVQLPMDRPGDLEVHMPATRETELEFSIDAEFARQRWLHERGFADKSMKSMLPDENTK